MIDFITLKRAVGEYTDSLNPEAGHRIPTGNMLWWKFGTSHTRYGRFLRNSAMNTTGWPFRDPARMFPGDWSTPRERVTALAPSFQNDMATQLQEAGLRSPVISVCHTA